MKVLLASNNEGKVKRFQKLLDQIDPEIELLRPSDLSIDSIDVAETADTLLGNATLKAQAYLGKVDMPILSNDTGFYVEGMGFVDAPKRIALAGKDESKLSKEEVGNLLLQFWKDIATKSGGEVAAAWVESFVVLYPDSALESADSRREILLTNTEFGTPHIQMPVRCLYYSKDTGKPAIQHTEEEYLVEMQPVISAIRNVLRL